jgi:ketosteroid isomerase-like protein
MTTDEHPHVQFLRRGFEALANGDMETVLAQFHEDLVYFGFDTGGRPQVFNGRDAFFGMVLETFARVEESSNQLAAVHVIGDDIAVAEVDAVRVSKTGERLETKYAMAFRIENGRITYGNDMIGRGLHDFWLRVGAEQG